MWLKQNQKQTVLIHLISNDIGKPKLKTGSKTMSFKCKSKRTYTTEKQYGRMTRFFVDVFRIKSVIWRAVVIPWEALRCRSRWERAAAGAGSARRVAHSPQPLFDPPKVLKIKQTSGAEHSCQESLTLNGVPHPSTARLYCNITTPA